MNRAFAREIVSCLRASPAPGKCFASLAGMGRRGWKHALEWLDHSGLALIFWNRLKDLGEEDRIPPEIRASLEQNLIDHRLRVAQMISEFDSINCSFASAKIPYAVLKGFALAPQYCPDIFLRPTYDYDYLVAPEFVSRAERALRTAGFVRKERAEDHPLVFFHSARPPRSPLSRGDLYSAAFPRTIELHSLFWDFRPLKISLLLPENPLARIELRRLMTHPPGQPPGRPIQFYALSEEDELLFQVLHIFRHILRNWCRLCLLLDIAYFLDRRAFDTTFWDRFFERLGGRRQLSEIAGVVFLLAAGVFDVTMPDSVSARTIRSLPRSLVLWVKRYGQNSALGNFADNKFSLFLHREFIQDEAAWPEIRRTRLFPMRWPSQIVQHAGPAVSSQLSARWKQGRYIVQRLKHHLIAAARYGLESPRWYRTRSRER